MRLTANRIAGILRSHGYKLTPQRHVILKVISGSHDHLTSEEILEKSRLIDPGIGRVTVFRTLDLLNQLNLVCRVHTGTNCRGYMMRRPAGHHHHLICSSCGKVVDFTDCRLSDVEKRLSLASGFDIRSHLLEFYGLCRDCITSAPA